MLFRGTTKTGVSRRSLIRLLSCFMVGVFLLANSGFSYAFTIAGRSGPVTAGAFIDIDTDGDQLGDTWETHFWGSITVVDEPYGDFDGDGFTNLWEFKHGTDPTDPNDPNYHFSGRNNALAFLRSMMDRRIGSGKRILYSYVDKNGNTEGFGWTYDNAISVIAFQRAGEWQRAKEVLDAYIWFQDKDVNQDGRIRRGYFANKPIDDLAADSSGWIPTNNFVAADQAIGDMAFMIMAALTYHDYLGEEDSAYLSFAKKLGDWIFANTKSDKGAGGYNLARNGQELFDPANFDRKSVENNFDVYVAFMRLYESLGDHMYRLYALHAKNFVLAMWNETENMLWTGTLDDGITINGGAVSDVTGYDGINPTSGQPEDSVTWGFMSLGEANKYGQGVGSWVENNCRVDNMDGFLFGYDFNADRDGIWFEGSSHVAVAYQMLNDKAKSDSILDVILTAQDGATGGVQLASHNGVTTSFDLWTLNTDLHIAPSAWLILAVDKHNPFWNQDINDPIPYEGGYNDAGDGYVFTEPWAEGFLIDVNPALDGTARAMANFDGTGGDDKGTISGADDGVIVKYEWDFDGKGTFDWSSTLNGNVTYWYTEIGTHLAKFRVTNDSGYTRTIGVTVNITGNDIGAGFTNPATSGVTASVFRGDAPLTVAFSGGGSDSDGYVASYEWDFDGNGEYDSYSDSSGNVTFAYREAGTFSPTLRITDNDGLTDTATLAVEVLEGADAPQAKAIASVINGVAPHPVTLNSTGSTGNIATYEWDFEGDGVYDWQSISGGMTTTTFGEPGTYSATLRVTDVNGISDSDTIKVRVEYNTVLSAPAAVGTADPLSGVVPFDSLFTHSFSIGLIDKYEWDFDGDKDYDLISATDDDVTNTYSRPGYYLTVLKVTDGDGLTDRAYVPIVVTGQDQAGAVFASQILTPENAERIYGNSVTVVIDVLPHSMSQEVNLQHKLTTQSVGAWANAGNSTPYPYRMTIDATALSLGDYNFRAPVNDNAGKAKVIAVSIDPNNWDIHEELKANGERVKQVKVKNNRDTTILLFDGTKAEIDPGTFGANDTLIVTSANGSRILIDGTSGNVLYHTEFILTSGNPLNKPVTITIPYDDDNDDGIVDGLNIPENDLKLYFYNEATEEWEAVSDFTIYPDENYVSGKVSHFSVFGLGGPIGVAAGGVLGAAVGLGSSGRSCFIATATYGTVMHDEVQSLRFFRDSNMLTNAPGELIISIYEKYSPPIADTIAESNFLKGMVRHYLKPIVAFTRFMNAVASKDSIARWIRSDKAVFNTRNDGEGMFARTDGVGGSHE